MGKLASFGSEIDLPPRHLLLLPHLIARPSRVTFVPMMDKVLGVNVFSLRSPPNSILRPIGTPAAELLR